MVMCCAPMQPNVCTRTACYKQRRCRGYPRQCWSEGKAQHIHFDEEMAWRILFEWQAKARSCFELEEVQNRPMQSTKHHKDIRGAQMPQVVRRKQAGQGKVSKTYQAPEVQWAYWADAADAPQAAVTKVPGSISAEI